MANKEFNDVQLDVTFTAASSRANITSQENISLSFGKLAVWYNALVPTGGSSGQFLGWNSSGTAKWVNNPNTDQNVKITSMTNTTDYSYYGTIVSGAGTSGLNISSSYKVNHTTGTASAVGNTRIVLGNSTASGTAGNEEGLLRLYSPGTGYYTLKTTSSSSNIDHTFPATSGTILNTGTTSFTRTLTSGTKIGTIKINGTSTDLYCETNTNTDTKVNVTLATTTKAYLLGTSTTPTATAQGVTSVADTGVYLDTTAGGLCATNVKASSTLCANTANSNNAGGIALYGTDPTVYGIMFRGTSNSGKHGYVQSDWATYFTMNQGATTRGWIFRRNTDGNVASISGAGNAVFNGTQTLDFVFA